MSRWGSLHTVLTSSAGYPKRDPRSSVDMNGGENGGAFIDNFLLNTVAACIAVAVSSPLNYARNMQFAAPHDVPEPSIRLILYGLREQVAKANGTLAKATVLSRNLLLGWGTLRAAVGMGFGSVVFDLCRTGAVGVR